MRIGIFTGRMAAGSIGNAQRLEYNVHGDTVNTAARLQEFTKIFHEFPLILSRDVWEELVKHPSHHAIKNLGNQKIRGKKESLEAFGFHLPDDRPSSMVQGERGFMPLQRIKGVYVNRLKSKKKWVKSLKKAG